MRTALIGSLLLLLGCARGTEPDNVATQNTPKVGRFIQMALLPGDMVSWVQSRTPPMRLELYGVTAEQRAQTIEALYSGISVELPSSERVPAHVVVEPETYGANQSQPEPLTLVVTPDKPLADGWHRLRIETSRLPSWSPMPGLYAEGDSVVARFNVASQPTVRRLWVCPNSGALQVRFSEPVFPRLELEEALELTDLKGNRLACASRPKRIGLDADGETLSVQCDGPLPEQLQLAVRADAFMATSDLAVRNVAGGTFAVSLDTSKLPADGDDASDCRVWMPSKEDFAAGKPPK